MKELFLRYPGFKTKVFTMSFDDGTLFDREMVRILDQYGIKCTFNLNSALLGTDNHVSLQELNDLYANHEIAVHTCTHPHLENLDNAGILQEVLKDREALERLFHKIVRGMAYPFGLTDDRVAECVRNCGIDYARTVNDTYNFTLPKDFLKWNPTCHQIDGHLDEIIERFLVPDDTEHPWRITAKVFYLWGHSYEFEDCFDRLENICKKLAGNDAVWYATNGEIFNYVKSYNRLEFSADGSFVYNPTDTDIYVSYQNKNLLIPAAKMCVLDD